MRTLLIALAALAALAASAVAKPASTLTARPLSVPVFKAIGRPDPATQAFSTDSQGARAALVGDDGQIRTVASPVGCSILVAGAGHLAYACEHDPVTGATVNARFTVTDTDGGGAVSVTAQVPVGDEIALPGLPAEL